MHTHTHMIHTYFTVLQVALAEVMYTVAEGPMAQVTVCVNIELGSLSSDATVALVTPPGGSSTGNQLQ